MIKSVNVLTRSLCGGLMILIFFTAGVLAQTGSLAEHFTGSDWASEEISDGIWWHAYHGEDYFESKQSINIVEVVWDQTSHTLQFGYSDSSFTKTSEFAEENEALAAVNGSFFDVQGGGSVVFFRVDGEVRARGAVNRRLYSESGGVVIDPGTPPYIIKRPDEGWLSTTEPTILGSGPLLVIDGEHRSLNNDPFNQNRHPRTAVATTDDGRMFLITVDGRSSEAYGMSTPELREFLESLGTVTALNLDGGGSTTMWIRDKGHHGVVNYPSDNGSFDQRGERGVANVLMLVQP
jgi:exopolysaccharide biosynthesis protein